MVHAEPFRGRRVRLTGWVKASKVASEDMEDAIGKLEPIAATLRIP